MTDQSWLSEFNSVAECRAALKSIVNLPSLAAAGFHTEGRAGASKRFSKNYLLKLGEDLPLPEISALLGAESVRERALALARSGDQGEAWRVLDEAQSISEVAGLSHEANVAFYGFQKAAEGYLYYKFGDFVRAKRAMIEALTSTRELNDDFGYDMEFRKFHLARNIIRVEAVCGDLGAAAEHTATLLKYADGRSARFWPFHECDVWRRRRALTADELCWTCDELVGDMISAMNDRGQALRTFGDCLIHYRSKTPQVGQVHLWTKFMADAERGDYVEALQSARQLLCSDLALMPRTRDSVIRSISHISHLIAPELVADFERLLERSLSNR
jgi:tetratricopeptide (TPR) repeat protein